MQSKLLYTVELDVLYPAGIGKRNLWRSQDLRRMPFSIERRYTLVHRVLQSNIIFLAA